MVLSVDQRLQYICIVRLKRAGDVWAVGVGVGVWLVLFCGGV